MARVVARPVKTRYSPSFARLWVNSSAFGTLRPAAPPVMLDHSRSPMMMTNYRERRLGKLPNLKLKHHRENDPEGGRFKFEVIEQPAPGAITVTEVEETRQVN